MSHPKMQDSTGKFLRINPDDLRPVLEAMKIGSFRYVCSSLVTRKTEHTFETFYRLRTIESAIEVLAEGHNCMLLEDEIQEVK